MISRRIRKIILQTAVLGFALAVFASPVPATELDPVVLTETAPQATPQAPTVDTGAESAPDAQLTLIEPVVTDAPAESNETPAVNVAYPGTIVIDPGHGGHDSGAIGPGGTLEKDVNLALSLKLAARLKKTGARVLLTRETDVFIPLGERTVFANANKADVFVSVHANASRRRGADGIEAFFLSFEASDDESRKLAAFENNIVNLDGTVEDAPMDDIKAILWDLTQTEAHHESSRLAEAVYSRLINAMGSEPRGVKQAPFRVLVGAAMPAVLVEVGFISNPGEERLLRSDDVQEKLAEAIDLGLADFNDRTAERVGAFVAKEDKDEKN